MAGWDEIHWVRTSRDIPVNDFLNYTVDELCGRYPKIPKEDIVLERHVRHPRRFPVPPEYRGRDPQYRKTVYVRSLSDLRDQIFKERTAEDIREQYPRFTTEEIRAEAAAREVRAIMDKIASNLRRPSPETLKQALTDTMRALAKLEETSPLTTELAATKTRLREIESNLKGRVNDESEPTSTT